MKDAHNTESVLKVSYSLCEKKYLYGQHGLCIRFLHGNCEIDHILLSIKPEIHAVTDEGISKVGQI